MPGLRRRHVLANAALVVLSLALALGGIELILRMRPTLLGPVFANGVLSRYTTAEGGIYYHDSRLRMNFMLPSFKTAMYYNGYRWTHETDALGFRNPRPAGPADIVLLGDSLIYGHGVDVEHTVAHFLEQITGRRVANLARQGDCAFQQAYLLTEYAPVFRPRHVVYFYFENDLVDLATYVREAEMRQFVERPLEEIRYPPRLPLAQALREREDSNRRRSRRLWNRSYVVKAARWLASSRPAHATPPPTRAPIDDEQSLAWRYTRKAIAYMQHVAARNGAQLVIAPITPTNTRHFEMLRATATEYGLPLVDTSALARDPANWLPGDGHFSPAGARRMAELVAARIRAPG